MKIIKQGEDQTPPPDWWMVDNWECRSCGCVFQLEIVDPVDHVPASIGSLPIVERPCPNCGLLIQQEKRPIK